MQRLFCDRGGWVPLVCTHLHGELVELTCSPESLSLERLGVGQGKLTDADPG